MLQHGKVGPFALQRIDDELRLIDKESLAYKGGRRFKRLDVNTFEMDKTFGCGGRYRMVIRPTTPGSDKRDGVEITGATSPLLLDARPRRRTTPRLPVRLARLLGRFVRL